MKKKSTIILIIVFAIMAIATIALNVTNKAEIELTQLSATNQERMMGYVIRTSNKKTIVIDGGLKSEANNLKECIEKYGNSVDYWFITHPHTDHVGAFIETVEKTDIEIKNIYYSANEIEWYEKYAIQRIAEIQEFYNTLKNEKIKSKICELRIKDNLEIDKNIKIEILGIKNEEITENAINNSSMVFKLYVNDKTIMFLGDLGEEGSNKLVNMYTQEDLKSNIVQISHHGNNGATQELYNLIDPEICLWPTPIWLWNNDSGEGYNTGNWTTLETREWIEKLGVKINYVAKDGNVTINIK